MTNQNGFTLIELIVVLAITSVIAAAAAGTAGQIYHVTRQDTDWSTATQQAQNAGYWISHDALMSRTVTPGTVPGDVVTLAWTDWETSEPHQVKYLMTLSPGGLYQLTRQVDGSPSPGILIADHIQSAAVAPAGGTSWTLTVSAASGTKTATRGYLVQPRVNSD